MSMINTHHQYHRKMATLSRYNIKRNCGHDDPEHLLVARLHARRSSEAKLKELNVQINRFTDQLMT